MNHQTTEIYIMKVLFTINHPYRRKNSCHPPMTSFILCNLRDRESQTQAFWLIKHSLMCNQCDLSRVDWEKLELQSDMFTENLISLFMRVFSYTLESQRDASSLVSIDLSKEI